MKNIFSIFWRDVKRILKTPPALLVCIALCFLPSLYAWINIAGFWDPYENTGNLQVCIVNEDEGSDAEPLGELHIGDDVVENLEQNDQFDWLFTDFDTAMDHLESGEAYAIYVIPEKFSSDITSLFSGDIHQPQLQYYVNEKLSPVAPKITDKGADALDQTINDTFVSMVSSAVTATLNKAIEEADADIHATQSQAVHKIEKAEDAVSATRDALSELSQSAVSAQEKITDTQAGLTQAKTDLNQISTDLADASILAVSVSESLTNFVVTMGPSLDEGSALISQASNEANAAIADTSNAVIAASGSVDASLGQAQAMVDDIWRIIGSLEGIAELLPEGNAKASLQSTIADLRSQAEYTQSVLDGLQAISNDTKQTATNISGSAEAMNQSLQTSITSLNEFRTTFSTDTVPAMSQGIFSIGGTVSNLSALASSQTLIIDQTVTLLDELSETLMLSDDALQQSDTVLAGVLDSLGILKTDVAALGSSAFLSELGEGVVLDPQSVADFMISPTQVQSEQLYPLNAYGSAMAPLFINLTLWIGVFMLLVIIRQEVDSAGIRNVTITQRYFGRGLLLAILAICQAIVCCTGCLAIGVQVINAPMFYLTSVLCSLAYLGIQYSLSATFQHVGKALCIILVFVQIPGATGLYPIEMTPEFFQMVYPMFPFTYGINAIRETTFGFYGHDWLQCIGVLMAFFIAFVILGIVTRPYVTNLNRLFARQIKESDIIIGETVELPEQHYKRTELIQLLSNREEYRELIKNRARKFLHMYPYIQRTFWITVLTIPAVATLLFVVFGRSKVFILVSWLVWFVVIVCALIVFEYFKDHLMRQVSFDDLSDEEIRDLYAHRRTVHSGYVPGPDLVMDWHHQGNNEAGDSSGLDSSRLDEGTAPAAHTSEERGA